MIRKFALTIASLIVLASCKEVPVLIDKGDLASEDTTYVTSQVPANQEKLFLVEELSGVQCVNCPAGMEKLHDIKGNGEFKDKLVIASIHVGTFAWFIDGKSTQDFVVTGSDQLLELILGGDPGKPCSAFDRLDFKANKKFLMTNPSLWPSFLKNAKDSASTTPINVDVVSKFNETADAFDIEVTLTYTKEVAGNQSLNIYLVEDKIIDAMSYSSSNVDLEYEFNHVLRAYVTPPSGRSFLNDLAIKEKGRVYSYRVQYKIDKADPKQALWNPENMKVIAFVNQNDANTKRVYQVKEVNFK